MHHSVHARERPLDAGAGAQASLHRVDVAAGMAAVDARAMARLAQQHDDVATKRSSATGDQDVHPSWSLKNLTTRRHASAEASASYVRLVSLKKECRVPGYTLMSCLMLFLVSSRSSLRPAPAVKSFSGYEPTTGQRRFATSSGRGLVA